MEQGEGCSIGSNFTSSPAYEYGQSKPMRKLRVSITDLATSKQTQSLSMEKIKEIEACLHNLFVGIHRHTPDHPSYSEMIFKDIKSLNSYEEGCANKAAISTYIKSEFQGLAWAHESLLSHHIGKLIEKGELVTCHSTGNYLLPKPLLLAHNYEHLEPKHDRRRGRPSKLKPGNKEMIMKNRESSYLCEKRQGIKNVYGEVGMDGRPKKKRGRPPKKFTVISKSDGGSGGMH